MGVVTISATYGAGGSEIGPAVAAMLGLPFVDRAIPAGVARRPSACTRATSSSKANGLFVPESFPDRNRTISPAYMCTARR